MKLKYRDDKRSSGIATDSLFEIIRGFCGQNFSVYRAVSLETYYEITRDCFSVQ